jgi:hypothetical protein
LFAEPGICARASGSDNILSHTPDVGCLIHRTTPRLVFPTQAPIPTRTFRASTCDKTRSIVALNPKRSCSLHARRMPSTHLGHRRAASRWPEQPRMSGKRGCGLGTHSTDTALR